MCKTSNCGCSLKPAHFKLSDIETSPPNLWMIELTCLIPVMCFSDRCNVFGLDGSKDCKSRRQNSTLNLGESHPSWLPATNAQFCEMVQRSDFFCLQLMKKV